jgi:tripartite-type tricarboxylate transporter receptor subunit TctC
MLAGAALAAWPAVAQAWPQRPIRLLVPFPAGSSPDLIARMLALPLGAALGQNLVVDNRPGAGGEIGTGAVAHAQADGYSLLLTIQGPLVTAPLLNRHLPYDPVKDLQPIGLVATSPNLLAVDPKLGAASLTDFLKLARSKAGQLNYGSVGNGSAAHLVMEAFMARAGIALTHVPYPGFPQVVNAMLAGQVQACFMVPGAAIGQVRACKLLAIGVTSLERMAALPDLATMSELGFAGFEATSWQALLAPARTPAAIVDRLARELQTILRSDAMRDRLQSLYFTAATISPEGLARLMATERLRWAGVIKAAGVEPE